MNAYDYRNTHLALESAEEAAAWLQMVAASLHRDRTSIAVNDADEGIRAMRKRWQPYDVQFGRKAET